MQFTLNIQLFAHKKGQGSVKNGRDSNPKYLGIKKYDGEVVKAGNIIVRQRGTAIHAGNNMGVLKDLEKTKNKFQFTLKNNSI